MTTTTSHDRMSLSITRPSDGAVDYVQILGDVDLSDVAELDRAAAQLHDGTSAGVCVDLGGTTFMDSTLVQFLQDLGDEGIGRLVICRPGPMATRLIQLSGLDALASVRADLPSHWPAQQSA
jgi:anti-anti-sigma factor